MRGRFASDKPKTNVTFALTDETQAKLGLLTFDPVAGRSKYGLKSVIAEELIKRFTEAVGNQADTISIRDLRIEVTE